jgi:hypothetical protein
VKRDVDERPTLRDLGRQTGSAKDRSRGFFCGLLVNGSAALIVYAGVDAHFGRSGGLRPFVYSVSFLAAYQFAYLWPWWRSVARAGNCGFAYGLKFCAVLTALMSGGCWTLSRILRF